MGTRTKKTKETIEFRYYEVPAGYVLPLLGDGWEQEYGLDEAGVSHPWGLHFHNCLEIGYCYHGHGIATIADQNYRYDDEEAFTIVPANIPHTTNTDPGRRDIWGWLFVDMDAFVHNEMKGLATAPQEILRTINKRGIYATATQNPRCAALIRLMMEECRRDSAYRDEAMKGYLRALVIENLRMLQQYDEGKRNVKYNRYIEQATQYISVHYAEDIRIKALARSCGLSESHFRRIFDESVGMTPNDYINMVRIDKACDMLLKEDIPMSEVGERAGYQTASSFNRNFKALTGMSPLQWKNKGSRDGVHLRNYKISAKKGWEARELQPRNEAAMSRNAARMSQNAAMSGHGDNGMTGKNVGGNAAEESV